MYIDRTIKQDNIARKLDASGGVEPVSKIYRWTGKKRQYQL